MDVKRTMYTAHTVSNSYELTSEEDKSAVVPLEDEKEQVVRAVMITGATARHTVRVERGPNCVVYLFFSLGEILLVLSCVYM